MTDEKLSNGNGSRWRFSKEIPLSLLGIIVIQTISFAVFLTQLNSAVTQIIKDNAESKLTAYTKDDAHKDRELLDSRFARLQDKDEEITRRIALLEGQINELKARAQK